MKKCLSIMVTVFLASGLSEAKAKDCSQRLLNSQNAELVFVPTTTLNLQRDQIIRAVLLNQEIWDSEVEATVKRISGSNMVMLTKVTGLRGEHIVEVDSYITAEANIRGLRVQKVASGKITVTDGAQDLKIGSEYLFYFNRAGHLAGKIDETHGHVVEILNGGNELRIYFGDGHTGNITVSHLSAVQSVN